MCVGVLVAVALIGAEKELMTVVVVVALTDKEEVDKTPWRNDVDMEVAVEVEEAVTPMVVKAEGVPAKRSVPSPEVQLQLS